VYKSRILYTGLEMPLAYEVLSAKHVPFIEVVPRSSEDLSIKRCLAEFDKYTHIIFTSKCAASIFLSFQKIKMKKVIVVGKGTEGRILSLGGVVHKVAKEETAEGVVQLLSQEIRENPNAYFLWPHAAKVRPVIRDWLHGHAISHDECILYDTHTRKLESVPLLNQFDEIVFTSPSTVDAFLEIYGTHPVEKRIKLTAIGPITQAKVKCCLA